MSKVQKKSKPVPAGRKGKSTSFFLGEIVKLMEAQEKRQRRGFNAVFDTLLPELLGQLAKMNCKSEQSGETIFYIEITDELPLYSRSVWYYGKKGERFYAIKSSGPMDDGEYFEILNSSSFPLGKTCYIKTDECKIIKTYKTKEMK